MADFRYLTPWVGDCLQLNLQGIEIELLKADVRAYIFLIRFQQAPYAILKTTALCHQAICPALDRLRVQNGYYALEWLEKHQPTRFIKCAGVRRYLWVFSNGVAGLFV
jgi:hypothetical protein